MGFQPGFVRVARGADTITFLSLHVDTLAADERFSINGQKLQQVKNVLRDHFESLLAFQRGT